MKPELQFSYCFLKAPARGHSPKSNLSSREPSQSFILKVELQFPLPIGGNLGKEAYKIIGLPQFFYAWEQALRKITFFKRSTFPTYFDGLGNLFSVPTIYKHGHHCCEQGGPEEKANIAPNRRYRQIRAWGQMKDPKISLGLVSRSPTLVGYT